MEPGPLAYDPMNTGQGSMGMGMGAGGPGATNFMSDTEETFKDRLLNPQSEVDQLFTLQARGNMEDPNKSPDEKRQSWRDTLGLMRMMDTYDIPTQQEIVTSIKADMLDMGIDLDAYSKINRAGDKYIAAGSTLTEATRAGYTPLQAISKALGAYGAAERAAQLPDPDQVNMAFQLYGMASDTRKAMLEAGATGAERDTFVVGPEGDQSVMALNGNDQKTLDMMAVPYRSAQESDIKGTPYSFLKNGEVVTEFLDPYAYARKQTNGIDMIEATPENLNKEMSWAGKDGAIESGTVNEYLVARDLGEDVRMVEPLERQAVIEIATGQPMTITTRDFNKDYADWQKDPENYNLKYKGLSTGPQTNLSVSSGDVDVDFSSGVAPTGGVSPTAGLMTGEVTDFPALNKVNEKQYKKVDDFIEAQKIIFEQKTGGIERFVKIGGDLLSGLGDPYAGGGFQRGIARPIAGIGKTIENTINFFTEQPDYKVITERNNGLSSFTGNGDIYTDILDSAGKVIGQSDVVFGNWGDYKLTENTPLWKSLVKVGLTDYQKMNTLAYNLAIAALRTKGIEDRGITNQKIALEMDALGFGGNTKANEDAVSGLRTYLGMMLDDYDSYNERLYGAAPPMTIYDTQYVPGKGRYHGGNQTTRPQFNPWVVKGFAKEIIGEDGKVTYESTGQLAPFDTKPFREQIGMKTPGETEKVTVRVGDDPSLVNAHFSKPQYQTTFIREPLMKPTAETTVLNQPLTIPLDLQNWGDMAISYTNQINAASERAKNDGLQPGTQAYANRMGKAENSFYTQYAVGYFGEAAAIDAPSPEREAFNEWIKYVRTFK